jgi:hypothetical protein
MPISNIRGIQSRKFVRHSRLGRLLLADFIVDLCVYAGYDESDIEVTGVDDEITNHGG